MLIDILMKLKWDILNFEGYFNIDVKLKDVLVINYLGMLEKQIIVEDFNDIYILLKT